MKAELTNLKKMKLKCSLTLDEYTSIRNRKYMNINCHFQNEFLSLGMIRITGSMSAIIAAEKVSSRLTYFGLDLKSDIVATVSDGASVMVKFGKIIDPIHIQCLSHAFHLCVE